VGVYSTSYQWNTITGVAVQLSQYPSAGFDADIRCT
jgi:hypothetical protein